MRISDLTRLAFKNLKGSWVVLPAVGFAIAAFCLCFAGAILTMVQEEKAQPYEIIISAQGTPLSDKDVADITKIADVTAASPVLQIPMSVSTGEYTAQLTLMGINNTYLKEGFSQGSTYPDNSVMPYIVLNETACKQFSTNDSSFNNEDGNSDDEKPDVDWLNNSFSVQLEEGTKPITSKVCGVLSVNEETEEEQQPAAYISLSAAKGLLQQSGQNTDYTTIHVRVKNIGCTKNVSKELAKLGLMVSNSTNELQAGWDADTKEMTYLTVIGIFSLICASFLLAAWKAVSLLRQRDAWTALRCLGMTERVIRKLHVIQTVLIALFGIAAGVLIAITLPSFLSTGTEQTNFMLQIPFVVIFFSVVACIATGIAPTLFIRRQKGS